MWISSSHFSSVDNSKNIVSHTLLTFLRCRTIIKEKCPKECEGKKKISAPIYHIRILYPHFHFYCKINVIFYFNRTVFRFRLTFILITVFFPIFYIDRPERFLLKFSVLFLSRRPNFSHNTLKYDNQLFIFKWVLTFFSALVSPIRAKTEVNKIP